MITNDDVQLKLTVIKHVLNDNGGNAQANDFNLTVGGAGVLSGVPNMYQANTPLAIDETLLPGYTFVSLTGDTKCPAVLGGTVTLNEGDDITCTITNDDVAPKLTLIKTVINDDGGTALTTDFTLSATGATSILGAGGASSDATFSAGTYTLSETTVAGYAAGAWSCIGGSQSGDQIMLAVGESATCTITNDDIAPTLTVQKICDPTNDTGKFNLLIDGVGTTDSVCGETLGPVPVQAGGHNVSETAGAGTNLGEYVTTIGGDCALDGTITLALAENKTCIITNTRKGEAYIKKTVFDRSTNSSGPPTDTQAFTFQLRQGATTIAVGTTLETVIADSANGGEITFGTMLIPGQTYQMCEIVMAGWTTTLGTFVPNAFMPPDGIATNPNVDNSILCVDFTVLAGETTIFTVDNTPPLGGRALTIGFWKNWSSCSGGGQAPELDRKLAMAELSGLQLFAPSVSETVYETTDLALHGDIANPDKAPDCLKAVRLLNKSKIDNGKKMASNPAFNLAAQLVAALLNVTAGAGSCPAATTAMLQAQALLDVVNFNGITHLTMTAAQITQANTLATSLDNYNNNRLCQYGG